MKILLTGSRNFVALDVVRTLHRQGHTLYVADSVGFDFVRFSKLVHSSFRTPSARFNEREYIASISHIITTCHIDMIVPLGEEVFYLARNQHQLCASRPSLTIHSGTIEQLESLHNKYFFYTLAASLGLRVPDSILVHSAEQVIEYQKSHVAHVILKPVYSRFANHIIELTSINRKQLASINWDADYILQEYVSGEPVSSYSYGSDDDIVFYASNLTTNVPSAMTNAVKRATPPEVAAADARIRHALTYTGQLGLDFISNDKGLYLLEANPRATIGYSLQQRSRIQSRLLMFHSLLGGMIQARKLPRYIAIFATYPDTLFHFSDIMPALASQFGNLRTYLRFRAQHPGEGTRTYASFDMQYDGPPYEFRATEATQSDSATMLELLEKLPSRGALKMIYTRQPDALASLRSDGEQVKVGLIKDRHDNLVIMGACSVSHYYVDRKARSIGYVSDFRKDPDFPYSINWLEMLVNEYRESDRDMFFCSIMASNQHAIDVFTKKRPYLPDLKLVGTYTLFVVNPKRHPQKELPRGFACTQLSKLPEHEMSAALAFLRDEGSRHDMFPVIDNFDHNHLDVTSANSYVLTRDGTIVGFASINDQRHKKQFIVTHYAWHLKLLRTLNPVTKALHLMPIPEENIPINCPAISLALVKDDDMTLYAALMSELARRLSTTHDMFMITVPDNSPHSRLFDNFWNFRLKNNLYAINFTDTLLQPDSLYTETSVLF